MRQATGGGFAGPLVGRDGDLAAAAAAVSAPPSVVVIEGEAGIGKTRLVQELRDHPTRAGQPFVLAACRAFKEPFPLGPVLEAVRGLSEWLPATSLSPVTGALRPLLPELSEVLPPQPPPLDSSGADRHRVFRALLALLASVEPLTVVLEDVHWADESTVEFLRYLMGDLPPGLSLVMTLRAEEVGEDVRGLTARLPANRREHVVLKPLTEGQTADLAASLLSADQISDDFARYLCERTGGLPFAIEEVTALLNERGLAASPGHLYNREALEALAVPTAVRDHVLERAGLLPVSARMLLDIVAVWQAPVTADLIAGVAGRSPDAVALELGDAIRVGLLVDHDGAVGFRHVLAAQALYDALPGPWRRELHNRAATMMQAAGAEASGRLAFHLRQAGRLAEWAVVAERAADRASQQGEHDEAARLLEPVLRHASIDIDSEIRLAVKLGRAARAALRGFRVDDLLEEALEKDPPREARGELQFLLAARMDDNDHDRERSRELFAAAAANSHDRPEVRAWALMALVLRHPPTAGYEERHARLTEVIALEPLIADRDMRTNLLGKIASQQLTLGDPQWRSTGRRLDEFAGAEPSYPGQFRAYESMAQSACFPGHHREAERLIRLVRSSDYVHRDDKRDAFSSAAEVLIDFCRGRWGRPAASVLALHERLSDQPRALYKLCVVAGDLALAKGDLERAAHWHTRLAEKIEDGDGADLVPMLVASQIRLAMATGDDGQALTTAQRYLTRLDAEMLWPGAYRCLPWLAAALTRAGQAERAVALGSRFAARLRGRDAPLGPAALAFADGFARAGSGDAVDAAAAFLTAAQHYDTLECPYEAAQAREAAVTSLAEAGRGETSGEHLRAAMQTYEQLGADRDRARAVRLARRVGVSVPSRHRGGPKGYGTRLTPREREVAELAAMGRTNREIAGELFLSAETVKKHIQAAMRKLEVPSRAALGRRLPPLT